MRKGSDVIIIIITITFANWVYNVRIHRKATRKTRMFFVLLGHDYVNEYLVSDLVKRERLISLCLNRVNQHDLFDACSKRLITVR